MRHAALEVECLELCGSRLGELFCLLRIGDEGGADREHVVCGYAERGVDEHVGNTAVWFFWMMILFLPWSMTQTWFWRSKGADTIASAKPSSTGLGPPS